MKNFNGMATGFILGVVATIATIEYTYERKLRREERYSEIERERMKLGGIYDKNRLIINDQGEQINQNPNRDI